MVIPTFATFAAGLRTGEIPETARHAARRCVVDWVAATLPGGVLAPAVPMLRALSDDIDRGPATLLPSGRRATARTAALINGAASHTVEFDDIYRDGLYHPGAPVIAAALAAAQHVDASSDRFLRGVIAGYEVSNRIAAAVNPAHYDFWHTTATVGFFGAATAAAVILDLDETRTAHAIAQSGTQAAGLQQAFRADAMSKPLHSGRAAEGGLLCALMAAEGITGALDILEGARGFGAAMSRNVEWDSATAGLGSDWTIERMTQKNHAACGHMHAAIDGVVTLVADADLTPSDIKAIRVGSYQKSLEICGNTTPTTPFEAKFSMAYCLAQAVLTGQGLRLAAFEPARVAADDWRPIGALVDHTVDPGCEAAFPKARSARVAIDTTDGRTLSHFAPTRKGDPDAPLSDTELSEKYTDLAADVLGAGAAAALLDRLWAIDGAASVTEVLAAGLDLRAAAE